MTADRRPPHLPMTPLLAAIVHQHRRAAQRLLEAGADPNRLHPLFGTPVHAATAAGNPDLLQLLLDHHGARNHHHQTPLAQIAASRASLAGLAQAQAMLKTMGFTPQPLLDQLSNLTLPTQGWDACERLLQARGAR